MLLKFRLAYGDEVIGSVLGLLVLLLGGLDAPTTVVSIAALGALAAMIGLALVLPDSRLRDERPLGAYLAGRLAVLAGLAERNDVAPVSAWLTVVLVAAVAVAEIVLARLLTAIPPPAARLPGLTGRRSMLQTPALFYVNVASCAVLVLLLRAGAPGWSLWLPAVLTLLFGAAAFLAVLPRLRDRRRSARQLFRSLSDYGPIFMLHWDADTNALYQITRWMPYLDRLGERYVVVVRSPEQFAPVAALTEQPVLYCNASSELESVVVDSLRVAFYVNNAIRNANLVRFRQLRHVQLNHGDSDKDASFNPVTRMFDKNFVAGQAAVDRFLRNGISTAPDFFEIVGRPQVSDVEQRVPGRPVRRVLYAPTWLGVHTDSAYSSLPIGVGMIEALLARGCEVIYRPHPYTRRSATLAAASMRIRDLLAADARGGRRHVFGRAAESEWSLVDCFNASDALISDVSSVVPDYLYSEKPFAVVAMQGTAGEFAIAMPVSRAGYVIDRDAGNLDQVLDDLLGSDPRQGLRREIKRYYLGDFPADRYADAFLEAARQMIDAPRRSLLPTLPGDAVDEL